MHDEEARRLLAMFRISNPEAYSTILELAGMRGCTPEEIISTISDLESFLLDIESKKTVH